MSIGTKSALAATLDRLDRAAKTAAAGELLELDPTTLIDEPGNPRHSYPPRTMAELADSMRSHGVIEPLKGFRNETGAVVLIAGHRRKRAAIESGLALVPVVIVPRPSPADLLEMQMIENAQREDLTPLEIARCIQRWIDEAGGKRGAAALVAQKIGKSPTWVTQHLQLLSLHVDVIALSDDGIVTERNTLVRINHLPDAERVAEIARLRGQDDVEDGNQEPVVPKTRVVPQPHTELTAFFGLPVFLDRAKTKVTLRIAAPDAAALNEVLHRLQFDQVIE